MGDSKMAVEAAPGPASYWHTQREAWERGLGPKQPKFSSVPRLASALEGPGPCDYAPSPYAQQSMEPWSGSFDRSRRWSMRRQSKQTPGPLSYNPAQPSKKELSKRGQASISFISQVPRMPTASLEM